MSDAVRTSDVIQYRAYLGADRVAALVEPQPLVNVVDVYKNLGATPLGEESVVALPCHAGNDFETRLCSCSNISCLRPKTLEQALNYALLALDGQLRVDSVASVALFTNLRLSYANPAMQISFWLLRGNDFAFSVPAFTKTFSVSPGSLNYMLLLDEPARNSGCSRCPSGVYIAQKPLPISLGLYDYFGNLISFCNSSMYSCNTIPTATVFVNICSSTSGRGLRSHEQINAQAKGGVVEFSELRISEQDDNYTLLFYAAIKASVNVGFYGVKDCNFTSSDYISVKSLPFSVTNNVPVQLQIVNHSQAELVSVDMEPLPSAIYVKVLDAFNNTVVSDCYSGCGSLEGSCYPPPLSEKKNNCTLSISVSAYGSRNPIVIAGTLNAVVVEGFAIFTDLALESNSAFNCDAQSNYSLKFDASAALTASRPIILLRPVHSISIDVQPSEVSARDVIRPSPRVSARDCKNNTVDSRNFISVEIASNGGYGTLRGRTLIQMTSGTAEFTDLAIDLTGAKYALRFHYIGRFGNDSNISSITSNRFDVFMPAPYLEFVPGTQLDGSTTLAGMPFKTQPQIKVFIRAGQLDSSSSLQVTASIGSNPGNQQAHDPGQSYLIGTTRVNIVKGLATFTDLSINKADIGQNLNGNTGYTLQFTTGDAHIESGYFHMLPQDLSSLWLPKQNQPSLSTSEAGNPFIVQPVIYLVDKFKNLIDRSQVPTFAEVGVAIIQDLSYRNTLIQHLGLSSIYLLRDAAISKCPDCCTGDRPILCQLPSGITLSEVVSADGVVHFTDLRIDIASDSYRLNFYLTTAFRIQNVTSNAFVVTNTAPSYPKVIQTLVDLNVADVPLIKQPIVTVVDRFENSITYDNIPNRTVAVKLHPPSIYWKQLSIGAATKTVCKFLPPNMVLGGTLEVAVDVKRGWGVFTDLMVRQALMGYMLEFAMKTSVGTVYVNTSQFDVQSGITAGICVVGTPLNCSAGGSCANHVDVVCVDTFGNINSSCLAHIGSQYGVPLCAGNVNSACLSVALKSDPTQAIECSSCPAQVGQRCLCSKSLNQYLPCTNKAGGISQWASYTCKNVFASGLSSFTDLMFYQAGRNLKLVFSTYVRDPWFQRDFMWSTESEEFDVTPTPPSIISTVVADSLNKILVKFDRPTNMPTASGPNLCSNLLDQSFFSSLGLNPKCLWIQPDELQITLGRGAYVNETTPVLLNIRSGIVAEELVVGTLMNSLPATTIDGAIINGKSITRLYPQLPTALSAPTPVILVPPKLSACDLVQADGRLSGGNLGRDFTTVKWGLDYQKSFLDVGTFSATSAPDFLIRDISFSSVLPGEVNLVTVTLRSNTALLPGTIITISGLPSLASCEARLDNLTCDYGLDICCPLAVIYGPGNATFTVKDIGPVISWSNDTEWILIIENTKFISEAFDNVFSFRIINPMKVQRTYVMIEAVCNKCVCFDENCTNSGSFIIRRVPMRATCNGTCSSAAVFEVVDRDISLVDGRIKESCNVSGEMNFLSVDILPSDDLPPGSRIVIGGLNGSMTLSGIICLYGEQSNAFIAGFCVEKSSYAPSAFWNATAAELHLTVRPGQKLRAGMYSEISFQLRNSPVSNRNCNFRADVKSASCTSWAKPFVQFMYPSDVIQRSIRYSLVGDILGSGEIVKFSSLSVSESNSIAAAKNVLKFSFYANIALPPQTQIHVIGLSQLNWFSKANPNVPVLDSTGLPSNCFSDAAIQGIEVVLTVLSSCYLGLPSSEIGLMTFALQVVNDKETRTAIPLYMSAQYNSRLRGGFTISELRFHGSVLESSIKPRFVMFSVSDSNNVIGQLNTITIQFITSVSLMAGSSITVSGLVDTQLHDESMDAVQIIDPLFRVSVASASFRVGVGTLVFNLTSIVMTGLMYTVRFNVRNGFLSISRTVRSMNFAINCLALVEQDNFISTTTTTSSSYALLMNGSASATANISELTLVSNSYNLLTITVVANVDIMGPDSSVTVHGLSKSKIPFANITISDEFAIGGVYSIFPNCSCSLMEIKQDPACSDPCPPNIAPELPLQARISVFDSRGIALVHSTDQRSSAIGRWEQESNLVYCRSGVQDCGQIVFFLKNGAKVAAGEYFVVNILTLNAPAATTPSFPALSIHPVQEQYNISSIGPFPISTANNLGVMSSKDRPKFVLASIISDTIIPGFPTKLEVTFQTNCPLISPGYPVYIQLIGFHGFATGSNLIELYGKDSYLVSKGAVADWNADSASITLLGGTVLNYRAYTFHFFLVSSHKLGNTTEGLKIQGQDIFTTLYPQQLSCENLFPCVDLPRASEESGMIRISNVTETNNVQGVLNNITIIFASNVRIFSQSMITFSGFMNSDSNAIQLFGSGLDLFLLTAWNSDEGSLVLYVRRNVQLDPNTFYSISFSILNPTKPYPEQLLMIRASGEVKYGNLYIIPVSAIVTSSFRAMQKPQFIVNIIRESNTVNGALNTLTISLLANVDLRVFGTVSIQGVHSTGSGNSLNFGLDPLVAIHGPSASIFNFSALVDNDGILVLSLFEDVDEGKLVVFDVTIQNRECNTSCGTDVLASYHGGPSASTVRIDQTVLAGRTELWSITNGGSNWSWIDKYVSQSTVVTNAVNKLTFTLRPNAPVFPGSSFLIRGLRQSQTSRCDLCSGQGDRILGLGCSNECVHCTSCIPIWDSEDNNLLHNSFLTPLAQWNHVNGSLRMTLNTVMNETYPLKFSVLLRNNNFTRSGKECTPQSTLKDISLGNCLTVMIENIVLSPAGFSSSTALLLKGPGFAVDSFNVPLMDSCATCIRPIDLFAFDKTMSLRDSLVLNQVPVYSPSLFGIPVTKPGVAAAGFYGLALRLINWIGLLGQSSAVVYIAPASDPIKPLVVINASSEIVLGSSRSLQLYAHAIPPTCAGYSIQERGVLQFMWSIECLDGPCDITQSIEKISPSTNQSVFYVRPGSLLAGGYYRILCTLSDSVQSSQAYVVVYVKVQPLNVKISGVSIGGVISRNKTYNLNAEVDDPEKQVMATSVNYFVVSWSCNRSRSDGSILPCSSKFFSSNATFAILNPLSFEADSIYYIELVVYRNASMFPTGIIQSSASESFILPSRMQLALASDCDNSDFLVDCTQVVESISSVIAISLCNPDEMGSTTFCERDLQNIKLSANKRLVLHASVDANQGNLAPKFAWFIKNNTKEFADLSGNSLMQMPATYPWLMLQVGALVSGSKSTEFRVIVSAADIGLGYATLTLSVSTAPYGGDFTVEPSVGSALDAYFSCSAVGWSADAEDLPLVYRFFHQDNAGSGFKKFLGAGYGVPSTLPALNVQLPVGDAEQNFTLYVGVMIVNVYDATTEEGKSIHVIPTHATAQILLVQAAQNVKDSKIYEMQEIAGNIADTLNAISNHCTVEMQSFCNSNTARNALRKQILGRLSLAMNELETGDSLLTVVKILASISALKADLDSSDILDIIDILQRSRLVSFSVSVDTFQLASISSTVLGQLLSWFSKSGSPTLRRTIRADILILMQVISNVSSMSVSKTLDGMDPVILTPSPSLNVITYRRLTTGFDGIAISDGRFGTSCLLPGDLLLGVDRDGQHDIEIMLAVIGSEINPFPESIQDIVAVEVRSLGTGSPLPVSKHLVTPAQLTVCQNLALHSI